MAKKAKARKSHQRTKVGKYRKSRADKGTRKK